MIYEGVITYVKQDDKGRDRQIKEQYIIEGETFTDVEARLYQEFESMTAFDVVAIKRSKIKEIANQRTREEEKVFLATLVCAFIDDEGNEKELKYKVAFYADNITAAHNFINDFARQGYDMSICEIKETKIKDVLK
jgi:hypothetical protein